VASGVLDLDATEALLICYSRRREIIMRINALSPDKRNLLGLHSKSIGLSVPCFFKIKNFALVFFISIFIIIAFSHNLNAQDYQTTVDWLNFVDVPSYLRGAKFRVLNPFYYATQSTCEAITEEEKTVRYHESGKAWFFIMCLNSDWKLSEKLAFGVLPIGSVCIWQMDLETWLKMKYFPLKREDLFFRLAVKVPLYQPVEIKNQPDIDFAVFLSKSFSGLTPEILFSYRYRFKTLEKACQDYGVPGNEFHYRIGFDFPAGKNTRGNVFLLGYYSQDKVEYLSIYLLPTQALVYKKPYKINVGFTLSHYFKNNAFFGKDNWYNITFLKGISWRNELSGWGLVFSARL